MLVSLAMVPTWAWVGMMLASLLLVALVGFEFYVRATQLRKLREQRAQHLDELTEWNARHGAIFTDSGARVSGTAQRNGLDG